MKYTIALVATCAVATAVRSDAEEIVGGSHDHGVDGPYQNYYVNPAYKEPSYAHDYAEKLPGADFNKQVSTFSTDSAIWDQNDYEERVKVEAEMLVSLEALKESVMYLTYDIKEVDTRIANQYKAIGANHEDAYENMQKVGVYFGEIYQKLIESAQKCQYAEHDLEDNRHALELYCQQFAFAPEMVAPCAKILTCKDTKLNYKYSFAGTYVHKVYDEHEHQFEHNQGVQ